MLKGTHFVGCCRAANFFAGKTCRHFLHSVYLAVASTLPDILYSFIVEFKKEQRIRREMRVDTIDRLLVVL